VSQKLLIVGDSAFAECAYDYFENDSDYVVSAFVVEREYLTRESVFGKPVVALEELGRGYPVDEYNFYVAIPYTQRNRLRRRFFLRMKDMGYQAASYVSSRAFVAQTAKLGEHVFVMEGNVIQPHVVVEDNVVLWSGNHVGHHSHIREDVFFSSHVVLSGHCEVGARTFLGVNCTIANNISIGSDCWFGPGSLITRNIAEDSFVKTSPDRPHEKIKASDLKV